MRALQQRLAGRGFAILLVNYGEARARVSEFVQRESLPFVILLDPNQDAPRAWRVRVLPSSFLIDPDGRIRYGVIGEIDWSDAEAGNVVEALLRESATLGADAWRGSAEPPGGAASAPGGSRRP